MTKTGNFEVNLALIILQWLNWVTMTFPQLNPGLPKLTQYLLYNTITDYAN